MRRVRLFDLEHLSLFSTMADAEIDSIIHDLGQPQAKLIYENTFRESLNRVEPGRSEEHSYLFRGEFEL